MAGLYVVTVDSTKDFTPTWGDVEKWTNGLSEIKLHAYHFSTEWKPWAICMDPAKAKALLFSIRENGIPDEYSQIEECPYPSFE